MDIDTAWERSELQIEEYCTVENSTKWKIFIKAVELFAERGIEAISMRVIAKEVGIKAGSIYNHFLSKEYIVKEMYDFYIRQSEGVAVDQETLLELVGQESPEQIFARCVTKYPERYELLMCRIMQIAMGRMNADERAAELTERTFSMQLDTIRVVLKKMQSLHIIREIDIGIYMEIYQHLCFSISFHMNTERDLTAYHQRWYEINRTFFSLIIKQ